jgi:hypothetical protein
VRKACDTFQQLTGPQCLHMENLLLVRRLLFMSRSTIINLAQEFADMKSKAIDRARERYMVVSVMVAFALAAISLLAGCASVRVSSDYDHGASFAGYHTYAWLPRDQARKPNPLAARLTQAAIDAEMQKKGYALTADTASADFVVDFTLSAKDRLDVQSYPTAYRGPWVWGRGYYGTQIDMRAYREGTLVIDIFDGKTHQPVWTGKATKELSDADLEHSRAHVQAASAAVLAEFPPL